MSLKNWKAENNESLQEEYLEYKYEMEQAGEKPLTFNQWAKDKYEVSGEENDI